ncbi:MAG: MmgE/PrpD family protein [Candidatus Bathyarchaeia archaeon]
MFTKALSKFVSETRYEDLPVDVISLAKKAILDYTGVIMAGTRELPARIFMDFVKGKSSLQESTVIGGGHKTTPELAALANGVSGRILDYDDCLDYPHAGLAHPTAPTFSAALAVAEKYNMTGKELIAAYCVGLEAYAKSGLLLFEVSPPLGWDFSGVLGSIGAAAAVANLLKLDTNKTAMSFGIAVALTGGLSRNYGTMAGPLQTGNAARNGIIACFLADAGYTSYEGIFENPGGFCSTFTGKADPPSRESIEKVISILGNPWSIIDPGLMFKAFPCAHISHFGADAGISLKQKFKIDYRDIVEIELNVPSPIMHAGRLSPQNGLEARFSPVYCLCRALIDGKLKLTDFTDEKVKEPAVIELMKKVKWRPRPPTRVGNIFEYQEVTVKLKDGSVYTCRVDHPKGEPLNPQTDEELNLKYFECASYAGYTNAREIRDLILNMEKLENVTLLTNMLLTPQ